MSRLISNKSFDTPYGPIPLKILASGKSTSKEAIIKEAIKNEKRDNPMTDAQLAEIVRKRTGQKNFGTSAAKKLRIKSGIPGRPQRRRNYQNGS